MMMYVIRIHLEEDKAVSGKNMAFLQLSVLVII